MKYYTSSQYTGKTVQKRILRIVLITALAIGILSALAVLGNLFRDRLQRAADLLALQPQDYSVHTDKAESAAYTEPPKKQEPSVNGFFVPLAHASITDMKTLNKALDEAAASHGGVSLTAGDKNGVRFQLDGIDSAAALPKKSVLTNAVSQAADRRLSVCATLYTSGSAKTDGLLLEQLAGCGVTEVLLAGLCGDALEAEYTHTLLLYLEHLRKTAPHTTVGIALSPALFQDASSAVHLDTLFSYFDYLALDLTEEESHEAAQEVCTALYGSVPYYNLAVLLSDVTGGNASPDVWEACGVQNVRFLTEAGQ